MVKEIKKYRTSNGREFEEEWKAISCEKISNIIDMISRALGETGYTDFYKKIIKHRKELAKVLNEIEDFDERGLDVFFSGEGFRQDKGF